MLMSMEPGTIMSFGGLFRDVAPGYLLGATARGRLISDDNAWTASDVLYIGEGPSQDPPGDRFRFKVGMLSIAGPAVGKEIAATRFLYAGAEWDADTRFAGKSLVVRALSDDAERREDEIISATIDGTLGGVDQHALWVLLCFISGNRLSPIAIEYWDHEGSLVRTEHRRGAGISLGRHEPFHWHHGALTPRGMEMLGDGILRLLSTKRPFPIANIIHHIQNANEGNVDTDAQHLVLAIHASFEAWNRAYGRENWLTDKEWAPIATRIRRSIDSDLYNEIPADVRDAVKDNLVAAINHVNETTMGWRQRQMFAALQIDISDPDNKRALKLRNELLHNGYFLKRWSELTPEEAQQRRDDVERLRRLAFLIVFRLTGYEGEFCSPIRLQAERIEQVPLPADIAWRAPGNATQ
jgi:hypothetical protein